ncbi:MAG: hypothetical protein LW832_00460 [Parachlamydia sp.]|jgi:hypothetical protein|nr:hypothetical protein [Parachlamydia sp.]
MHVILVGDTKDDELNKVVKKDLKQMSGLIDDIFDEIAIGELDQINYKLTSAKRSR